MPTNYEHAKIYRIVSNTTPPNVYFGSTTTTLSQRMASHRSAHRRWLRGKGTYVSSFDVLSSDPTAEIELVRSYPCCSKGELEREERKYIEGAECVNVNVPNRTGKERIEQNREQVRAYFQQYYKAHKAEMLQGQRERNSHKRSEFGQMCRLYETTK